MIPGLHMIVVTAKARQDDLLREAERDRLATVARATMTDDRNRRFSLRRRSEDSTMPNLAPARTLTREPAV